MQGECEPSTEADAVRTEACGSAPAAFVGSVILLGGAGKDVSGTVPLCKPSEGAGRAVSLSATGEAELALAGDGSAPSELVFGTEN